MTEPLNAYVVLRAEGVSVVLDLADGCLPAVVHWGADLGELSVADVAAMVQTGVHSIVANIVDEPVRVAVMPEHHTGWLGRPGLSCSRAGGDWSHRFIATRLGGGGGRCVGFPARALQQKDDAGQRQEGDDRGRGHQPRRETAFGG